MNPPHLAAPGAVTLDVDYPDRREIGTGTALSVGAAPLETGAGAPPERSARKRLDWIRGDAAERRGRAIVPRWWEVDPFGHGTDAHLAPLNVRRLSSQS